MYKVWTGVWSLLLAGLLLVLGGCGGKASGPVEGTKATTPGNSQPHLAPAAGSSLIHATATLPAVCDGYTAPNYYAPPPPQCTSKSSSDGLVLTCVAGTLRSRSENPAFTVPFTLFISVPAHKQKNDVVVYYLHGLGSSGDFYHDHAIRTFASQLEGDNAPAALVGIDLGPFFFFTLPDAQARNSGLACLLPNLLDQVDQALNLILKEPYERAFLGISMGGGNEVMIAEMFPQYFARVLLACPAIPGVSPLSSTADLEAAAKKEGLASADQVLVDQMLARMYMGPSTMDGLMPEALADKWPARLPLLLLYNESDEHLFGLGARRFLARLNQDGFQEVIGKSFPGGHCAFRPDDLDGLSSFLTTGAYVQKTSP